MSIKLHREVQELREKVNEQERELKVLKERLEKIEASRPNLLKKGRRS